jgi:hypothetical protein
MADPDTPRRCTGQKRNGQPCTAYALVGTNPARCPRHPTDGATLQQQQRSARQQAFLSAFALVGNLSDAATSANVDRSQHYRWLDDPDYAAAFEQARATAVDRLEREAMRRAVAGVEETVWYKGEAVGTQLRYSDTLLMFLLNGWRPEVYTRQRTVVHAQSGFDADGRPFTAVDLEVGAEALAEAFSSYRHEVEAGDVLDVESSEAP